ncbi:PIN domain-containing protein (plasmid) [Halorientalis pallida]|uniref:PIN domain-containing protein n=1 Tax=Halorientalis pallida TaxID=2479928 RepID=UPI003C702C0C
MTTKLLDTTFLIHYWAGRDAVASYLDAHEDEASFLTTTINLKEIAVGRQLQRQLDPAEIRATFDWLEIVPFRPAHAFVAAELEAPLHDDETTSSAEVNSLAADVLVAAVADEADATVVTRNVADFERLGVSVEGY